MGLTLFENGINSIFNPSSSPFSTDTTEQAKSRILLRPERFEGMRKDKGIN